MIKTLLEKPMNREESYAERRQLFKHIWDASLHLDEKEDIMNKPKVIKTLRMDEIDKCPIGKTKKQRIKNLRHVCNRILDFCDRQDADDQFYEQAAEVGAAALKPILRKKVKSRVKKRVRKAKSLIAPHALQNELAVNRFSVTERDNSAPHVKRKLNTKLPIITNATVNTKKSVKLKTSKGITLSKMDDNPGETVETKRKIVKKKLGKKKKVSIGGNTSNLHKPTVQIISV